jgi:hypothetical protein
MHAASPAGLLLLLTPADVHPAQATNKAQSRHHSLDSCFEDRNNQLEPMAACSGECLRARDRPVSRASALLVIGKAVGLQLPRRQHFLAHNTRPKQAV